MRNALPCVGLVVLVGSLTFVVAPDEETHFDEPLSRAESSGLPPVVIDAGHGGRDEGARANGLREKDLTLDLAHRVSRRLELFNFKTILTRSDDRYLALPDRASIGNRNSGALFVSLHFNHSGSSLASGVETFYEHEKVPPESAWTWIGFFNKPDTSDCESGETLAAAVQTALVLQTEAANRGIKARDLHVVRHVRGPSILVEAGFLSNPIEARLIANPEYRDRLANAIADGIMGYVKSRPAHHPPARLAKLEG